MTCIAAIQTPNGILLGADSAVDFGTHTALVDDKLFTCAGMWCGGAGDALAIQYVRHAMPPCPRDCADPIVWASKRIAPRMRKIRDELIGIDESVYAEFLFAHRRALFLATLRGEVLPCTRGFAAIGTGAEYAMATIWNTRNSKMSAEQRLTAAIMTASEFVPGSVRPPVRLAWAK